MVTAPLDIADVRERTERLLARVDATLAAPRPGPEARAAAEERYARSRDPEPRPASASPRLDPRVLADTMVGVLRGPLDAFNARLKAVEDDRTRLRLRVTELERRLDEMKAKFDD